MEIKVRESCNSCGSKNISAQKISTSEIGLAELSAQNFAVTDKNYGTCVATVTCADCGLIQPSFELEFEQIVGFYADMEDWEYLKTTDERGRSNFSQVDKVFKACDHQPKRLIEIGSGNGYLLGMYQKAGCDVYGVEPNKTFADFARETFKVNVDAMGYEQIDESQRFDTLVALDVVEHVVSVDEFMKKVSTLLSPRGIAIVVTPNKSSLTARMLGKKWWHIRPPHLYYFTPRSFKHLAGKYGLQIKREKQFYWTLPLGYLMDSVQRLVFKRVLLPTHWIKIPVIINTFDSKMFVLCKK